MKAKSSNELLAEYCEAAQIHGRATDAGDARRGNRAHDRIVRLRSELMSHGEAYQQGMLALLKHRDPHVRVWAASDILSFAPDEAVRALREVAAQMPKAAALNAKMTLKLWEAGEWKHV